MRFDIMTLFPDLVETVLSESIIGRARKAGIIDIYSHNIRDYSKNKHRHVDDTPYGGGDGMLLRCEPVFAAIESVKAKDPTAKVILPTPVGKVWNQEMARELQSGQFASIEQARAKSKEPTKPSTGQSQAQARLGSEDFARSAAKREQNDRSAIHYIIICPHYEGYDERILTLVDYKISLGHYVLTGGELPALIIIDSVVRLIPGVLGGENSAAIESFSDGDNLEYPQYTKPYDFRGMKVPDVLLSGNHGEIAKWRAAHSGKASS